MKSESRNFDEILKQKYPENYPSKSKKVILLRASNFNLVYILKFRVEFREWLAKKGFIKGFTALG